jgi:hypothetical protein
MKRIFWIIGGAAALYFLSRYKFSQKANFLLRSVRVGGGLFSPIINIDLAVQNPTNSRVTFKSITGSLSVNNQFLANVSAFGDQVIQPNSETILKLQARPSATGIFSSVRELLSAPMGELTVNFTGSANLDGITYPINETKTV